MQETTEELTCPRELAAIIRNIWLNVEFAAKKGKGKKGAKNSGKEKNSAKDEKGGGRGGVSTKYKWVGALVER